MEILEEVFERDKEGSALGRHSLLLGSLVLLLVALPLLESLPGHSLRFPLLLALVLISAIYMNRTQTWVLWAGIVVGGGALVGLFIANTTGSNAFQIGAEILGLLLLGTTTAILLNTLVKAREVILDTVIGGICVYLLLGVCFALIYRLIVDLHPDAILWNGVALEGTIGDTSTLPVRLLYFSFVTLTTVGYGDMLPHTEPAQMMAVTEAIMGQLYLAIFIARLMGLYASRGPDTKSR
jgi:voltage-gated potassium channel